MASTYFNNKRGVSPQDQSNFNMYSQEDQDALNGNSNQSKQSGFKPNYGAMGMAAAQGSANIYSTYKDPNATGNDKYEATQSGIGNTVGAVNPIVGGIMNIGNGIGKPIKANSEQFDSQGNLLNENKARRNAIGGALFDPIKAFSYRKASGNWGDINGKGYTNWLENQEKTRLKGLQPEQPTYEDIQRMAMGGIKYPDGGKIDDNIQYIQTNKGIIPINQDINNSNIRNNNLNNKEYNQIISNSGMSEDQYYNKYPNYNTFLKENNNVLLKNRGNSEYVNNKFAMGGYNNEPNSEIEKQENVMLPDGGSFQGDGPSHENGGIKLNLPDQSKIFSDRLKMQGTNKTFAQLNKSNNIEKEDKILESNKFNNVSKNTANLMKEAKNKLSEDLFQQQEFLKQNKISNYAKRLGVNLDNNQYAYGGIHIKPENKGKFTEYKERTGKTTEEALHSPDPHVRQMANFAKNAANWKHANGGIIEEYPDGGRINNTNLSYPQKLQAYSDSLNLYNSGQRSGQPNWKWPGANESALRLNNLNGVMPTPIGKKEVYADDGSNGSIITQSEQFKKPTKPLQPVPQSNYNTTPKSVIQPQTVQPQVQSIPQQTITPQVQQTVQPEVKNYSSRKWDFSNPSMKTMNYYDQSGKVINSENYDYNNQKVVPIKKSFAQGGIKKINGVGLPNDSTYNTNYNENNIDNSYQEPQSNKLNQFATQAAYFAANNAGNIYDLARSNKIEVTKYDRAKSYLIDPTAAIRDIDHQNRIAEYDVRSASGGNAGSYLANRTSLATNAALNKDRTRQQYANTNAEIQNQNSQFNSQISMRENDANAMNRAAARSTKQAAIARIGSNTANQMNDGRASDMDQRRLDALVKMYPSLSKDPEMLKYIASYKK